MKLSSRTQGYDIGAAQKLLPLLSSIAQEIEERSRALEEIEERMATLTTSPSDQADLRVLTAEAAVHRRELRLSREELSRFGCSVLGTEPLTIRIPGRDGEDKKSFVWQTGDALPK